MAVDLAFFSLVKPSEIPDMSYIEGDLISQNHLNNIDAAYVGDVPIDGGIDRTGAGEDFAGFLFLERSALVATGSPLVTYKEDDLITYEIQEGDTISSIADGYGISIGSILQINDIDKSSLIKPGETIVILPVSEANGEIVVPRGPVVREELPDFLRPVSGGWNWGQLHDSSYMPAVDISSACGTPILAADDGVVTKVGSPAYYNSGYGGYVVLLHPNGTQTFYAHNSENLVEKGDKVEGGDIIAKIGNTGLTRGATGCHVHFGVSGATNPFAR